jgi:glycogen synthase
LRRYPARMRIAFLTPEFPTETDAAGGLAAYVSRMALALQAEGHVPEVFTLSTNDEGALEWRGVTVHRVKPARWLLPLAAAGRLTSLVPAFDLAWSLHYIRIAAALADAFRARHALHAFDLVQSSDYGATGLFVGRSTSARHIVRCSWAPELFLAGDGRTGVDIRAMGALERRSMRRAHGVCAPSEFLAGYYRSTHGLRVHVIRPPFVQEPPPADSAGRAMPNRYLMFFGQIGRRKGTDVLAEALRLAWLEVPDLTMVWAGYEVRRGEMAAYQGVWGHQSNRVQWLGSVARPQLFAILQKAVCAVLPSRWDNFPNTAIESLSLGVPVIGTTGSSLDEIVEHGVCGDLVPIGDAAALADALVRAWRGQAAWSGRPIRAPAVLRDMSPSIAVSRFLSFALESDEAAAT